MEFVDTFEMRFPGLSHAEVAARNPSPTRDLTPPLDGAVVDDPFTVAFVDGSRWIAKCPFCAGAEVVNFTTKMFFCCSCRNQQVGHACIRVKLPVKGMREKVEGALLKRPDWMMRAWFPQETIADLEKQNKAHGVTVGGGRN